MEGISTWLIFSSGPQDSTPTPLLGCLGEGNLESCFHPPMLQTNARVFMESRKMVLMNLLAEEGWRRGCRQRTCGRRGERREGDEWRKEHRGIYTIVCELASW